MDKLLLTKYNSAAPRYTSYPPANHFSGNVDGDIYRASVIDSNIWNPKNISLYFHIPFCSKRCHYCGCNAIAMRPQETVERYINALVKEIEMLAGLTDMNRKVSQVHFGGGTPNSLSIAQLEKIMAAVDQHFNYIPDAERAIECNPAYLDPDYIDALLSLGFNRFSLGIQDFDEKVLKAVNRDPSKLPPGVLMEHIRKNKSTARINLDFIYGLPYQQPESFFKSIDKAIQLRPDRLVTFSYAHMPSLFKGQEVIGKLGLPSAELKWEMFSGACARLRAAGYVDIGLDHYALKSDELSQALSRRLLHRNFQGYCTRATTGQVYGIGVSSISQLQGIYAQNTKLVDDYIQSIENEVFPIEKGYNLTFNDQIIRECINEFMCNRKLIFAEIAERLNTSAEMVKNAIILDAEVLDEFTRDNIIRYNKDEIELTENGLLFIRNVAASLDPLMKYNSKTYSGTI